jgi:DNA-binding NarL/FixJ family response regulator
MDKLKVFISDDSATIRKHLVTMALDLPGMDMVGQAEDAPGSLAAIRQTRPDVVILDIRMPGGNGIEVLREVKKMNPAPRVIMFTNYAHAQYREKCVEAGADFFLRVDISCQMCKGENHYVAASCQVKSYSLACFLFTVPETTTTEGAFLYGHNNQGGIKDLSNPISWLVRLAVYAYASARARN